MIPHKGKSVYRDRWTSVFQPEDHSGELRILVDERRKVAQLQIDRFFGKRRLYRVYTERSFDDLLSLAGHYVEEDRGQFTTLCLTDCSVVREGESEIQDYELMDLAMPSDNFHELELQILNLDDLYGAEAQDDASDQEDRQSNYFRTWRVPTTRDDLWDTYRFKVTAYELSHKVEIECEIENEAGESLPYYWTGNLGQYMDALNERLEKAGYFYLEFTGCSDQPATTEKRPAKKSKRRGDKALIIKMTDKVSNHFRKWNNELFRRSVRRVS